VTSPAGDAPLAFVYNWIPDYRRGLFELLAERQRAEFLLFGGRTLHPQDLDEQVARFAPPAEIVSQRGVYAGVRRGRYRGVVASTNGRIALPAAYAAARRARIPFVLWATMWRHPRTAPHLLTWPGTAWIYRQADAVVTYGPHVSRYVNRFRNGRNVFEAPQALDNREFEGDVPAAELGEVRAKTGGRPFLLFAGRLVKAKGIDSLGAAWRRLRSEAGRPGELLVVAGQGPLAHLVRHLPDSLTIGHLPHQGLRAWYSLARAVVVPSVPTRAFVEPWGYVVNEAFLRGTPVIASDAVGAVAGGLVEHRANGLVFGAGDAEALAAACRELLDDPQLAARLGVNARQSVSAYTHEAQAGGFEAALRACGIALPR
jgi:glycosyltransferase involved in cell wall biosynthesis